MIPMAYGATVKPRIDPILNIADLYWYANAEYQHFLTNGGAIAANGETVGYFESRGSSSINATQATAGSRGTISAINGRRSLAYDGGDFYEVGDANDWNFLHNSAGFTVVLGFKKNASNPGNVAMALLDTVGVTSANTGLTIFYENRSIVPATDRLRVFIGRGVSGEALQDRQSADSVLAGSTPHIIVVRYDGISTLTARVDGTQVINFTSNNFGSPSSGDSTFPLNLGRTGSAIFPFTGQLPLAALYSRRLNDTEVGNIETFWKAEYGIS